MTRLANTVLILLALVGSTSGSAAQSRVPQLNLHATCSALGSSDSIKIDTQRCLSTENDARAKLANGWSNYSAADRDLCTQTARLGGIESYVQLLTCLELQQDVVAARSQGPRLGTDAPLMQQRPAGLPRQ